MRFVDDVGKPTARYHAFLDDTTWPQVLAEGIRDAYPDLFRVNRNAHSMSRDQLSGKIKSLGEGKISPAVLKNMTKTFGELVKLADFTTPQRDEAIPQGEQTASLPHTDAEQSAPRAGLPQVEPMPGNLHGGPTLVYRIEIVLPAVRDQAIYDAIFRSAREHLLK
jgi:hypothetical protein